MKVKDIMTPIIKTTITSTVGEAAKIMTNNNIGSLLIEEEEKIAGIVTERDILKFVAEGKNASLVNVKDILNPIITISTESSVEEANQLMKKNNFRRLPVEENGKIVGIITIRDVSNNFKYSFAKGIIEGRSGY
jgi:CBS domain-containing protein